MPLRMPRPVQRKSTSFHWYRKRVPRDILAIAQGQEVLVTFPPSGEDPQITVSATIGTEINFSLRTRDPRTAKARSGAATAHLEHLFRGIRAGPSPLSFKQCVALSGEVYRLFVDKFEDNPGPPDTWAAVKALNRAAREGRLLPRLPALKPGEIASARSTIEALGPDLTKGINSHEAEDTLRPELIEQRFGFLVDWVLATKGLQTDAASRAQLLLQLGPRLIVSSIAYAERRAQLPSSPSLKHFARLACSHPP